MCLHFCKTLLFSTVYIQHECLTPFSSSQLQCNIQTKRLLNGTYLGQIRDSEDNNNNNNQKSSNQGESSAINEEDDIDTALNKLEKSLANTTVTDNGHANTDLSATKAPATTPEFKLALSEQLLLMQPPKTADYQEVQELLLCPGQRMLSQLLMGVHSEMRQN